MAVMSKEMIDRSIAELLHVYDLLCDFRVDYARGFPLLKGRSLATRDFDPEGLKDKRGSNFTMGLCRVLNYMRLANNLDNNTMQFYYPDRCPAVFEVMYILRVALDYDSKSVYIVNLLLYIYMNESFYQSVLAYREFTEIYCKHLKRILHSSGAGDDDSGEIHVEGVHGTTPPPVPLRSTVNGTVPSDLSGLKINLGVIGS
jgi:hypothetical protein